MSIRQNTTLLMRKVLIGGSLAVLLATAPVSFALSNNSNLVAIEDYEKDVEQAISLYKKKDYEKALPALEAMAKLGDKKAQYMVGVMYLSSQGTQQDLLKSYAWLTVANEQKTKAWQKPLNWLDENIDPKFLKIASQEAAMYVEKYGVKAQKLKCRPLKTLGTNRSIHTCVKSEVKPGYYLAKTQ
ncbi:sel1 repeat family protein [Thalassotalea euphylliae]|uniref:Sel1 repeat family protein n=1 Tax=Thalassotalea euphylliae TaxID=1655234 RepID=A0A3E0TVU7_9GAMM|nr:sel1 repeat family protein [Thalassotalea euphylliae]REL28483.1 sel1 repeat family protein [Thalassotalea euphylliae]